MSLIETLEAADRSATLAINSIHCPASDWMWLMFSSKKIWFVLYLAVAVFLISRLGWKKGFLAILSCIAMVLVCDQGGNVVKEFFHRVRPCSDPDMISRGLHILDVGGGFSFYSAHAANSVGFAACTSACFGWDGRKHLAYRWGIGIWAAMVSASRIFVACHFLGDVIVGAAAGAIVGFTLAWAFGLAARRIKPSAAKG